VAVAFLLVASCFRLPAGHVPGRDRLRQARHLAAAAVAAVAVVAEAVDHEPPAFFLVGRALHWPVLHHLEARPADEVRLDLFEVHPVPLRP
jgi:hypothetical protein